VSNINSVNNEVAKNSSYYEALETFADWGQYAIPVVIGGYSLLSGNLSQGLSMSVMACVHKFGMKELKKSVKRERPQQYYPDRPSAKDHESFPSSHAGGAFLGVGYAIGLYGITSPVTITAIALASLVGLSRCLSKKHWPTDVLAGAVIGTVNGIIGTTVYWS